MNAKDELSRLAKPVDSSSLHMLVYSYLLHNNCGRTAQAFARTCGLATLGRLASCEAPQYLSSVFNHTDNTSIDTQKTKGKEPVRTPKLDTNGTQKELRKDVRCSADTTKVERANELIDHHIEYLRIRQSICSSIEAGEPQVATDLLSSYFRPVLIPLVSLERPINSLPIRREFNATLLRFRLDTQYYVELVMNHQELDALQFGQRTLWRYPTIFEAWLEHSLGFAQSPTQTDVEPVDVGANANEDDEIVPREELKLKRAEIMQHITDVAALVAYPDPRKSTLAYLLAQERRSELAAAVNSAILRSMRFPEEPALVTLVRQLATTSAYLVGYRSSARTAPIDERPQTRVPWVLDTFVNSDDVPSPL
ncbi:hypothetical protein GGH19_005311 [Coemansia sp. RSA 1807]|nr:hypothetical protein GGH98_000442 [Coemansia sp. RSA 454]KAJ2279678.1 hypothetical protein EV176_001397 [Coemansia sp. RSA 451]KAJ2535722.1 hypothetical protein IWW43_001418 [Coemansia sp. RSA 1935]KAJ2569543.1 hypothetical protein GGH19_005311 [Coemansia sp. RSA 1807]KAJ2649612.1 hypothetical protein IW137_001038 [Coemansia sp. RSA 1287]KAJ2727114.1 hypothetical protein H4S00_001732 [Coemansia sp. D1744]